MDAYKRIGTRFSSVAAQSEAVAMMAHVTEPGDPEQGPAAHVADNGSQPHEHSGAHYQCRDFANGVCTRGSSCRFMHGAVKGRGGKGGKGKNPKGMNLKGKNPPAYQHQQQPPAADNPIVAQLALVLSQLLGGLSSLNGSSVTAIAGATQAALQRRVAHHQNSKRLEKGAGAYPARH